MRGIALTSTEINRQLQQGRNYKRLYEELKPKYDQALRRIGDLEAQLAAQERQYQERFEAQAARIEQLEAMVFGRKPKGKTQTKLCLRQQRSAHSYRRPQPADEAVTGEEHLPVSACAHCGGLLTGIREYVRYVEDVILAALGGPALKTVTKQTIERGWCTRCGQFTAAASLRGQTVSLGPNVRLLTSYLATIQGLTYGQIQCLLMDLYQFPITDGEIELILARQREVLLPAYEQLKTDIRAGPAHFDETRYPIQAEQNAGYAWVMAGADRTAAEHTVVFKLADSRGGGNAKGLAGARYGHAGITDRYGAYKFRFVPGKHQICWAHLARNARDITKLQCLGAAKREYVNVFYQGLSALYAQVRRFWKEPYDQARRTQQATGLCSAVLSLCQPDDRDPKQLQALKTGILAYQDSLFVCLTEPNVPPDNNKAERAIRPLVMKRKRSFGVKTKKGARTMEVLLSVAWSLWYTDRANFFPSLRHPAVA